MKIGLIDVDGHNYPNLALMKISAYHKAQGDSVSWYDPLIGVDKVYASKVFSFTPDYQFLHCDNVEKGGSGYDLKNALRPEIEAMFPDYSLYDIKDTAFGFLTRGCPRRCPFCIVSEKEGAVSKKVADLNNFWNGQKFIKLLDPNLFACNESLELLEQLKESRAYVDFTQGLDARLLNDDAIHILKDIKIKMVHFAWDNMSGGGLILNNILRFMKMTGHRNNVSVYVLTNFNTTFEEDLERVYALRDIGVKPYIMIYNKEKLPSGHKIKLLARYVNNKLIFNSIKRFEEYDCRRG